MSDNSVITGQRFEFKSHAVPLLFLAFISFWSFFYNNGVIEIDSMEARNLVTAREILENNNWFSPSMNGEIRLAKPPLPTWFAALVSLSVGETDSLAILRIPNAVSALLLVFLTYGFAWTLGRDKTQAFMAAAILASSFLMVKQGHRASWDIFTHTFMLAAMWAFIDAIRNHRGWPMFAIFGSFMGLAFMSKGPVSFFSLLLPFILSYMWIYRFAELKEKWRQNLLAFAICLAISVPWPLYIWLFHHEALLTMMSQESDAWVNKHLQPFWYYWDFLLFSGLWLVVTVAALAKPFAEKHFKSVQEYRFLLLWLVLGIVLLSLMPEKKSRYLLPTAIPLALLGGSLFRAIMDKFRLGAQGKADSWIIASHTILISLIGVLLPVMLFHRLYIKNGTGTPGLFILVSAVFLIMVVSAWIMFKKKNLLGLFFLTLIQFSFISFIYMDFYRDLNIRNPGYKVFTEKDAAILPPGTVIFLTEHSPGVKYAWDLKHKVKLWRPEEAKQLLESGKAIGVISWGDPDEILAKRIGENVKIEVINRVDYKKRHTQEEKTVLSLVRLAR